MARQIDEARIEKKNAKLEEVLKSLRESFNRKEKNIYEKLMQLRLSFLACNPNKTGWNNFSKFHYFTLEDIVPVVEPICQALGLCSYPDIEFENDRQFAVMYLIDMDSPDYRIKFRINMADITSQGQKSMQEIGSVKTYARRYLWLDVLDSAEFDDEIDATSGFENKGRKPEGGSATVNTPPRAAKRDDRPAGSTAVRKSSLGPTTWKRIMVSLGWDEALNQDEKDDLNTEGKAFLKDNFGITRLEDITEEIAAKIDEKLKEIA